MPNEDDQTETERALREFGMLEKLIAAAAFALLGFLAMQVWVNTGRIAVLETRVDRIERDYGRTFDSDRDVAKLSERVARIETKLEYERQRAPD